MVTKVPKQTHVSPPPLARVHQWAKTVLDPEQHIAASSPCLFRCEPAVEVQAVEAAVAVEEEASQWCLKDFQLSS